MKADLIDKNGSKIKEIELPSCFSEAVREDLISKAYYISLRKQPYAPYLWAGMLYSASGKIKHRRRKWKTAYGYGISRVPRKIMTKRGSRFYWVGATISSTRGGREAHPPKVVSMLKKRKMNKKEKRKAFKSAISASGDIEIIRKRYEKLKEIKIKLPIIIESSVLGLKTKEINLILKKIFGNMFNILEKNRGILFIIAKNEKLKTKNFEFCRTSSLNMQQLAPGGMPGRIVIYTENAIKELGELK